MKKLNKLNNLKKMYSRAYFRLAMVALIMFLLFLFSFVSIVLEMPFAISIITMLMIIPAIIFGITSLILKHIASKYISRFTPDELARINYDLETAKMDNGVGVTRDAVISANGRFFLYPVKNILWIYNHVMTTSLNGVIPVSKDTNLVICGTDGKRYFVRIKNKSDVITFLFNELQPYKKSIVYGYNDALDMMYKTNIYEFIELCNERAKQAN